MPNYFKLGFVGSQLEGACAEIHVIRCAHVVINYSTDYMNAVYSLTLIDFPTCFFDKKSCV